MNIGICFDRPEDFPHIPDEHDTFAEFEPESTIAIMGAAISKLGHTPVRLGGPKSLLTHKPEVDVIWNIAEGFGTRNREAWAPILAEMWGIPLLGSDAHTLSTSLDKVATKILAQHLGIPTSPFASVAVGKTISTPDFEGPWFVKPRYEGTAKGIGASSICTTSEELSTKIAELHARYHQDVLIEKLLSGSEFTVAVSGFPLRAHPIMQRAVHSSGIGWHVMEGKSDDANHTILGELTTDLESQLSEWSLSLCGFMEVKDFARLDFKCDAEGNPHFLEINPLPTFAVDNTFAIVAELEGIEYAEFLAEVLAAGLRRLAPK